MQIELALVTSKDYYLTKGTQSPALWASKEDQQIFFERRKKAQIIVMGSGTFNASEKMIFAAAQQADNERVVFTKEPEKYKKFWIPQRLTFANLTPRQFVKQYQKYDQALLVAGEKLTRAFFKDQLVKKVYWTIEPVEFGEGLKFDPQSLPAKLHQVAIEQLNHQGTILYTYEVQYPNENSSS